MKCTNKSIISVFLIAILCFSLSGCTKESYSMPFARNLPSTSYTMINTAEVSAVLPGYSEDICVDYEDYSLDEAFIGAEGGGVFDLTDKKVLYGKNLFASMNPASTTKVMTALVALKYGNLTDRVLVTENALKLERDAQTAGLRVGDTLTLEQALNIMLVCSANDAALAVAEHVGGSVEGFCDLMNAEALRIGATGSHFTNPHGLTDELHKTTPYDLYLIFNEALKYDDFRTMISQVAYTTSINDANGNIKDVSVESTNLFFKGAFEVPGTLNIIGGKTGTTAAAGSCLVMYAKDSSTNKEYITVVLKAPDRDTSYQDTLLLLTL